MDSDDTVPSVQNCRAIHGMTIQSDWIDELEDGPKTIDEVQYSGIPGPGRLRSLIRKIENPYSSTCVGGPSNVAGWSKVYYLHSDLRRAIRKAILTNYEYFEYAFGTTSTSNQFASQWDEQWYTILCEEWQILKYRNKLPSQTND